MKRLHVHVAVEDLTHSIGFYSTLFAAEPAVVKPDYAKWMLDDPRVNFAISTRSGHSGVDHLGIQVETADELHEVYARLQKADRPVLDEGATTCCYAKSEKSWITDPQGLSWETFLTSGESTVYGDSADLEHHPTNWRQPPDKDARRNKELELSSDPLRSEKALGAIRLAAPVACCASKLESAG